MSKPKAVAGPCCARKYDGFRWSPCRNPGKVEVDGKSYCGVHDPAKKAARQAAWEARYEARSAASSRSYRIAALKEAVVKAALAYEANVFEHGASSRLCEACYALRAAMEAKRAARLRCSGSSPE